MRAKWSAPIRKYWKISEQMMVKYCDLAICDSVNIEKYIHECYDGKGINGRNPNGVAPGMTASNINNVDPNGNLYNASVRGKRVILADEIAEVVCFLLSDVSKCITGTIIPCDDGEHLR